MGFWARPTIESRNSMTPTPTTTLDIACGPRGGAARFLAELDRYFRTTRPDDARLIGQAQGLTPSWLVAREFAARGSSHRIAINNASFVGGQHRTVLLRNALHFAGDDEIRATGITPNASLRSQTAVVRHLAKRADRLIAPCSTMANRVAHFLPSTSTRIEVRFHPVTMPFQHAPMGNQTILVPIINAPYKNLTQHFSLIQRALMISSIDINVATTTDATDFPDHISNDPSFQFLGIQSTFDMQALWASASAIFFPPTLESFGYALAEARCLGIPVIAPNTAQNHEIAGDALRAYTPGDASSLADAVTLAIRDEVHPDPAPFDSKHYFDALLRA